MWVRLITSPSWRYVSNNGSVNGRCFPELWSVCSHTPRAEKVFPPPSSSSHSCSWEHRDFNRFHSTLSALTISILSHLFCSLRHAVSVVLMYKTPSMLFLSLHTFTPALHSLHYQLCTFSSLLRIQQVYTASLNCVPLPDLSLHVFSLFFHISFSLASLLVIILTIMLSFYLGSYTFSIYC